MDGRSNADLNGLMFADTPWVISPQAWIADLPGLYADYWPAERRLGRLHAMGYDAYHLVAELFALENDTFRGRMDELNGATGRLYLEDDGRVHRRLAWAQFQGGEPVALPRFGDGTTDEDLTREGVSEDDFTRDELDDTAGDAISERAWQDPIPDR